MTAPGRILVLGAGVVGTTAAYFLARRGFRVTVVERLAGPGLETSFANGGLLTPSMADPWASPGLVWKMLKWLGREDAPFLLRPRAVPGLLAWGTRFLGNCREGPWRRNTEVIFRLAAYSHGSLQELTRETGLAYDLASVGTLRLFRDRLSMDAARRSAALMDRLGVAYRILDAQGCVELEPALAPRAGLISGGMHFPDDECGDAYRFTGAVAERCRGLGVEFRFDTAVRAIEAAGGAVAAVGTDAGRLSADHYVVALGNGAGALLRPLGLRLPIYPVKGYSVTFAVEGWNNRPKVPLIDDVRKIGVVPLGERLRVAGTAEFAGDDRTLNPRRIAQLVGNALELFPDLPNPDQGQAWTGLRPMTPDGIPILGATPLRNLWLDLGHGHLGWTLAAGSGRALADLVAGARPAIEPAPYGLARFA